jgi:tRNA nucleotidyltransferase (CCA-adding enzyme)
MELKPKTILKVIEALDAYRKPEQFEQYLLASEADFRGRPGYEDADMPNVEIFKQCYEASKAIDVRAIVAQGLEGKAISETLNKQRIEAITQLMKKVKQDDKH